MPSLHVPSCNSGKTALIDSFEMAADAQPFPHKTSVELCHTSQDLKITMKAHGGKQQNKYKTCNSDMWNQEVMEMFIAPGSSPPQQYLEVEVTPQNALYVAKIDNPDGMGTNKKNTMIDCGESGIRAQTSLKGGVWKSTLLVPLNLINDGDCNKSKQYTGNFFRVAMKKETDITADCTSDTCTYGAWKSTHSNPPSFHRTNYFRTIQLS